MSINPFYPLRTSDTDDVWAFARGCMRTYPIFKEKAAQFNADLEIQAILAELNAADRTLAPILTGKFTPESAAALKRMTFGVQALAGKPLPYEKLDQLAFDPLMGVGGR